MLVMAEREELGSNILHLDEPLQRPRLIANIELDDALILLQRELWLREIGQWLRAGYDAVDQPLPGRLTVLLKELKGRRH
jgi:hypothetical protein